ncbi:MAG: copper-binding protein [Sulfuricurvum sp.]|uniref:copper-binding protein n=1 Tax=Sulfuricurvum sp. TaxID=2025608 RepID=UPI0027173E81|nr:copper-binding protein [Sulfuricurvum sp.]MDO9055400.1 copper-binding protein [Sulfuricurvum sp.]MDP2851644.1 copper-binding protein [Sulfuricurvum sp.]
MKIFSLAVLAVFSLSPLMGMGDEHQNHISSSTISEQTFHSSGTVKSIAQNHESIRIFHNPIPELKWPAMNMEFDVIDHDLTHPLEVGDKVDFEFVQKEGKNIIIKIKK